MKTLLTISERAHETRDDTEVNHEGLDHVSRLILLDVNRLVDSVSGNRSLTPPTTPLILSLRYLRYMTPLHLARTLSTPILLAKTLSNQLVLVLRLVPY